MTWIGRSHRSAESNIKTSRPSGGAGATPNRWLQAALQLSVLHPFFLSRVEKEVADERCDSWRLYRLHAFAQDPRIFTLTPPLEDALRLRTETWRASF